jgi:AraC family transcriptional regulator
MSRRLEDPLSFRTLHEGPVVEVRDYHCRACRGGPSAEEHAEDDTIVLMRHGAFCKHFGRRTVTADVNQAVFFAKGSTYRVSHPADSGDRGTVFAPSPGVLDDIVRQLDPSAADRPGRTFPSVTAPCDPGVFWRHRVLVRRLVVGESEPLRADVTALEIVADVLGAVFARHAPSRRRRRAGTDADHADRAEAAKTYLAGRLGERISLDDVARAVHASPFHLARVFRERAGVPIHRYLTRLRLRASLERLADGADDLSALALGLGFSSHSHFADAFRREFGRTPSDVRRDARSRTFREMSKDLEV